MKEPICFIGITKESDLLKAKVQSNQGRYIEIENQDLDYLLEMVYQDISMEIDEEEYW